MSGFQGLYTESVDLGLRLLVRENDLLTIRVGELTNAVIRAGKACEEAATQLMAKDAEIARLGAENRRLLNKNESLRKSRECAATDTNQYLNEVKETNRKLAAENYRRCEERKEALAEVERLRKELASLLDAACTHRYNESRLRDELSKAIDQAATSLAK